jgi:ABC-type uncharacterized transport system substrate-binding protein
MAFDNDPVGSGFIASLARPGRNISGLSALAPELSGKRLELLNEVVPKLSRVATFGTSTQPGAAQALRETELAAAALKVELQNRETFPYQEIHSFLSGTTFALPVSALSRDVALRRNPGATFQCCPLSVITVTVFLL